MTVDQTKVLAEEIQTDRERLEFDIDVYKRQVISDCTVNTGDSLNARIQGGGYVGGITGFQNDTDIFNAHVMGTIGGSGSQAIGGVTGKYASGKMKAVSYTHLDV